MGNYVASTNQQQQEMLATLGLSDFQELYQNIPTELKINGLDLPNGKSELEVRRILETMGRKNQVFSTIFRGAGAYRHYIPSLVKQIVAKEEFMTSYTPYQPEISQGSLQAIFEYQTMICELTGMDAANASVYDGPTAVAEAINMCLGKKMKVVLSKTINPMIVRTVETYFHSRDIELVMVAEKDGLTDMVHLAEMMEEAACFVLQQPNYYGGIEDAEAIEKIVHQSQAKFIMNINPVAIAVLKSPGEVNADIAVGDSQPFGLPLAFGGPYIGFMAAKLSLLRKLPGRIVGETVDEAGERAFVLTLQAREQHIRREKAASNICSNQALCALTNAVYLSVIGTDGLKEIAHQCYRKAHYLATELTKINGVSFVSRAPFFHEFVVSFEGKEALVLEVLAKQDILGGYPVGNGLLWCVTEMNTKEQMDQVIAIVKEVCQ